MGVLSGLSVLDLSWGIAGPAATMLMADNGAQVTRIERPGHDPFEGWLDYRTYHRGKRSAELDLRDSKDYERFLTLVRHADVLVESFADGTTAKLRIDYATLSAINPRLIYCTISGYGDTSHRNRPGFDQLVAARSGYQWEVRAFPGSAEDAVADRDLFGPDTKIPRHERRWFDRDGPVFTATPGPSISAAYLASFGISAALRARNLTGVGQHVRTSLLQGVIAYMGTGWQRSSNTGDPGRAALMGQIMTTIPGVSMMSGPWSLFETKDDRWINLWTSRPEWYIIAGAGDELRHPFQSELEEALARTGGRAGSLETQLETRMAAIPIIRKFTQREWVDAAAAAGIACQPVRSPEEVLTDQALLHVESVITVPDDELGPLRQPGVLYKMYGTPTQITKGAPKRGAHTAEVRAWADAHAADTLEPVVAQTHTGGPLAGIRVLDFGLAVAGPWCGEILAQMGADVIKVDPPGQNPWLMSNMGMKVNRSKRHISLDAKHPQGKLVVDDLVRSADVVIMNMRPQASLKLGLDYESLREINPSIVYCRTAGFDPTRAHLPGNDQTANAVAGNSWEDGGMARGGRPYFSGASGGDLGNGSLAAIAIMQALYHRDRTGAGQQVETNIMNAVMFSWARAYSTPDGKRIERPTVDAELHGFSALYRLFACKEGWLCIAVFGDAAWSSLCATIPSLAGDARFATAALRTANDAALGEALGAALAGDTAAAWFARLDAAGVPCEVSDTSFSRNVLDDPELRSREWIVSRDGQRNNGRMEMFGRLIEFSGTPTTILGPPDVPGQRTRVILNELGYSTDRIDALVESKAVFTA